MQDVNVNFLDIEAQNLNINPNSLAYQYLVKKTKASDRGSKARRSLGNLYALYVLCEDYINDTDGSTFSNLMLRMKSLPFGSKLQNHPLDNRLNDEVKRTFKINDDRFLPVQNLSIDGQRSRKISEFFLKDNNVSAKNTAQFICNVINQYIDIIKQNQNNYLDIVANTENPEELKEIINEAFEVNSDARLFEIVSFAILHIHFRKKTIDFSIDGKQYTENLMLYRTGRTNANDGGIDFVLKPLGKFYQVTEVLDFRKYFLDFEKVNKFPISFVIKTDLSNIQVRAYLSNQSIKQFSSNFLDKYLQLFDEIYTNIDLKNMMTFFSESDFYDFRNIICLQFQLEYGLLD